MSWVFVSFLCSSSNVSGNDKINSDNITRILDRLLDGYDNRLRPGSGGGPDFRFNSLNASCVVLHFLFLCKLNHLCCRWHHGGENRHLCDQLWTCFRCEHGKRGNSRDVCVCICPRKKPCKSPLKALWPLEHLMSRNWLDHFYDSITDGL